jgi:hypothetical protein
MLVGCALTQLYTIFCILGCFYCTYLVLNLLKNKKVVIAFTKHSHIQITIQIPPSRLKKDAVQRYNRTIAPTQTPIEPYTLPQASNIR